MTALSRAHALLQKAFERGDGHVVSFQNDELRALLEDATISACALKIKQQTEDEALAQTRGAARAALSITRDMTCWIEDHFEANFGRKPTPEEWQNLGKNQQGDKP